MNTCPYDLVAPIGSGGFAQVFRGVRRDTGFVAAIKIQRDGPVAMARFRREIEVLRQLDHPHVMPILEADPAGRWYAMPLAEHTLRQQHERDPLDWSTLREALSSVCGAMLHMHARDLVHRDASPGNVLYLPNGHWVLADMGLVRRPLHAFESLTKTGMHFGTPRFSAPEVHHDPRSATSAADAYSLGALASWFTQIPVDRTVSSSAGMYWSELVRNTVRYDPNERWTVSRIAAHVAQPLPTIDGSRVPVGVRVGGADACMRCGGREGFDGAGRCARCGFLDEL